MNNRYCLTLRILHWTIAFIILAVFCSGLLMSELSGENVLLKKLKDYHKSFGVLVLILAIIRILVRLITKAPSYNTFMSKLMKTIAKSTHFLLYILMVSTPLSGIGMVQLSGRKLYAFGIEIPNYFIINNEIASIFYEAHQILPYILIFLVTLHIAATLKHIFINKDNIFDRISISFKFK